MTINSVSPPLTPPHSDPSDPFNIDLIFGCGFSNSQRAVIESATRWVENLITQGLPDRHVDGQWIDDLQITLSLQDLDGAGNTLARTRLQILRTDGSLLPLQSITQFDWSDLAQLEHSGRLFNVMQHELLSAMGFGTLWEQKGLVANNGTAEATYIGTQGVAAFHDLGGLTDGIPVEPNRPDAPGLYWNERWFQNELMTYDLGGNKPSSLSLVTLAALQDLGYQVDLSQADEQFRLMGGMMALKAELSEIQLNAWNDLQESMRGVISSSGTVPTTSNDGWMYSSATELASSAGQPNLLWRNSATWDQTVWLMNGTSLARQDSLPALNTNWQLGGTGDFDGDGKVDLLWRNYTTGENVLWLMDGTNLTSMVTLPAVNSPTWRIEGTGDFNQDGKVDILWRDYGPGENQGANVVWLMDGMTQTGAVSLPSIVSPTWQIEGTGDFNQDGKVDILWCNYGPGADQGQNVLWLMDGTAINSTVNLLPVDRPNWHIEGTGDLNGDGKVDILWRDRSLGDNAVWMMNGTERANTFSLPAVTDLAWVPLGVNSLFTPTPTQLALATASNTGSTTDTTTSVITPVITGKAMPGMLVKLFDGTILVGQSLVD